jgi:hypothetical protein
VLSAGTAVGIRRRVVGGACSHTTDLTTGTFVVARPVLG